MLNSLQTFVRGGRRLLRSEKAFAVFVLSLFVTAFIPTASAGYNFKYTKLLDNCDSALNEAGFEGASKKLVRKIDAGSRFKFWIDVNVADKGDESTAFRAYCEGTYRRGEVEVFAFTEGQWRPRLWSVDTEAVLKEYYVKQ